MASINLDKEENINVAITTDTPINTQVQNINYIPGYKEAEEERRKNELERIAYYEEIQRKVDNGEFNGEDGAVGYDGKSIEYNWNGTELGIRQEGDEYYEYTDLKGEQGDQGIQGETGDSGVYIGTEEPIDADVWKDTSGGEDEVVTKGYVDEIIANAIGGALNGSY